MVGLGVNNSTQVLVQSLMNQGGLTKDIIGKRLMTFGVDGVYVFQGVRSRVTKHIYDGWAPHSMGMHCMAYRMNLAVQTLFCLPMVNKLKVCHPHFTTIFVRALQGTWSYKACRDHGDERGYDSKKCQNRMDSYVIPYQACYGKI